METHPGYKFSHLIQLKFPCIPRIALPNRKLCPLDELDLKCTDPPRHVVCKHEMYAKMALLMFYPFQQLNDLKYNGSYWRLFHNELQKHINKEDTAFWKKGFQVLQNIQDRSTLEKRVKCARDPISTTIKNKKPKETNGTQTKSSVESNNIGDILDMDKQPQKQKIPNWNNPFIPKKNITCEHVTSIITPQIRKIPEWKYP